MPKAPPPPANPKGHAAPDTISDADKQLVRACFVAAEDVLEDMKDNRPENMRMPYRMTDVPEIRVAMARMFMDLKTRGK